MYALRRYTIEIQPILQRYKDENRWFRWWSQDGATNILNGWRMYKQASTNALGFLLLGDTAIRTDKLLLLNFGLTSAHGVQEQKDIAMIEEIMDQRRAFAMPSMPAVKLLGSGSILSDKEWSPLLNDSFVLGGVNRCQDFHLADDAFDSFTPVFERRAVFGEAAKGYADPVGGAAKGYADPIKEKWKAYFRAHPTVFYESWGPRVFAREVIGMATFGYRPVFTRQELGFVCADPAKARGATFLSYLNALRAVNFGQADRAAIMGQISTYLFGAPGILT